MGPLKVGFIGGGQNSAVGPTHAIACQMDKRFVLEAGCFSSNYDINLLTAVNYGVDPKRVYKNWLDLLKLERKILDAICVLTPTNYHSDIVLKALEMGYAVICEKALAGTVSEVKIICEAVKSSRGFLAVTYNYTGYPMLRELKEMINVGKLGSINQIQIEMPQEGFARLSKKCDVPQPQTWRLEDGLIPTISLDLGVHLHNLVYFLTEQKPLEVIADQATYGHFKQVIDDVKCIARYTNKIQTQIWYSKSAIGHRNGLKLRVYGEKGSVEWYQMQPEDLKLYSIDGKQEVIDRAGDVTIADLARYNRFKSGHPSGFIEAFANYYYDIADCIIKFKNLEVFSSPYMFGGIHALEGLIMLEAIALSAKNNSWVKVK